MKSNGAIEEISIRGGRTRLGGIYVDRSACSVGLLGSDQKYWHRNGFGQRMESHHDLREHRDVGDGVLTT